MSYSFRRRNACPVCGDCAQNILFAQDFTEGETWAFLHDYYGRRVSASELSEGTYELVACDSCGLIYQAEVLADSGMQQLYEHWIAPEDSFAKQRDVLDRQAERLATQVQSIRRLVGKAPSETRVLDFGMGWGGWCRMAAAHGYEASGMELSEGRIRHVESMGITVLPAGSCPSASYDFINCEQVLEHVPEPLQTLSWICDALIPGGYTRISVPNGGGLRRQIRCGNWTPSKDPVHPLEHINCFCNRTLIDAAGLAGLRVIRQPVLAYPCESLLTGVRSKLLPHYLRYRSTNLYFRRPIESEIDG